VHAAARCQLELRQATQPPYLACCLAESSMIRRPCVMRSPSQR
jgi:hypothetical protein